MMVGYTESAPGEGTMSTAAVSATTGLDPLDPLDLDAQLSDEERLIRDTVRGYVRKRFLPPVAAQFEAGTFDASIARELGELGLLGMHERSSDGGG